MQMTVNRYKQKKLELLDLEHQYEECLDNINSAAAKGDLSENAEYQSARDEAEQILNRKNRLKEELTNVEIIESDISKRISLGSVVDVTQLDIHNKPIKETRRFTLEEHGDTVVQKILGAKSPLGKAILNGTDGIFEIPDNGGRKYFVKKVFDEAIDL